MAIQFKKSNNNSGRGRGAVDIDQIVQIVLEQISGSTGNSNVLHTSITNIDLKSTGIPNEYVVEIIWEDASGNTQTTTDSTPLLISPTDISQVQADIAMLQSDLTSIETDVDINSSAITSLQNLNSKLGWIQVGDDQYTSTNQLAVVGNVRTLLPNNGASILNVVNAENASTWWDSSTNKFKPDHSGDSYDLRVQFTCNPALNNRNLTLELDIGGTQGVIWDKTLRLARGAGVDTRITETLDVYTLSTFVANGGEIYITCDGDVGVYDIIFKIEKKFYYNN